MGDKRSNDGEGEKKSSWLKTILGTLAGLLSGAVVMYLSPLLDKVVKPAKPVANFAVDPLGMTVSFHNRSSGGAAGWWDFGDGSALEPLAPNQDVVTHTYANPGTYVAKLTLHNLIGEESERTVNLQLDNGKSEKPTILDLQAVPISPGSFAPATFRLVSTAKGAKLCVWDFGDDQPLEFSRESPNRQDRLITFKKPGGYTVKLAAVNGEEAAEKTTIVYVDEPPTGTVTATLSVSDSGTRVDQVETTIPVTVAFPAHQSADVFRFDQKVPAQQGYEITGARWEPVSDVGARGLALKVAEDRLSVHLTGELVKQSGSLFNRNPSAPTLIVRTILTLERRAPEMRVPVPVATTLSVPGSVLIPLPPLPANWINPRRQMSLELRDGDKVIWHESQLPRGAIVRVGNRGCLLNATPLNNQVRLELTETKNGQPPSTN